MSLSSMRTALAFAAVFVAACAPAVVRAQAPGSNYHVTHTYILGGDGGWDYVILDAPTHRLFIGRGNRVMVVRATDGKLLGEVMGINGAHGVAIDHATGHGFATSGRDSSIAMFDLKTLQVLGRTKAAEDADAILFDPASNHVFSLNGDAGSATVVDPVSGKAIGTIDLGGKPEYGVSDGQGKLYVNLEDKGAVAEVDARAMKVIRQWPIAPCESPTGLALDPRHHRLFSGCRSRVMAISDAVAGRLITTLPIGAGVDAAAFDPGTRNAFASNGDGTLSVIHEDAPNKFHLAGTAQTATGARTMALDPKTHRIFLVTAKFGPAPVDSTAANPRRRPPMIPGSFMLLVLDR